MSLDENARMELFSEAYVRALASRWGFDVVRHQTDRQSIDLQLTSVGRVELDGRASRLSAVPVMMQLKCTHRHQPKDGVLKFPLPIKNYDDLRDPTRATTTILVVVCVPESWDDRMVWAEDELRLLRCAYWTSLEGFPPTTNTTAVTVELRNLLSADELNQIMFDAAEGEP